MLGGARPQLQCTPHLVIEMESETSDHDPRLWHGFPMCLLLVLFLLLADDYACLIYMCIDSFGTLRSTITPNTLGFVVSTFEILLNSCFILYSVVMSIQLFVYRPQPIPLFGFDLGSLTTLPTIPSHPVLYYP